MKKNVCLSTKQSNVTVECLEKFHRFVGKTFRKIKKDKSKFGYFAVFVSYFFFLLSFLVIDKYLCQYIFMLYVIHDKIFLMNFLLIQS